jgi:hypothetical protein
MKRRAHRLGARAADSLRVLVALLTGFHMLLVRAALCASAAALGLLLVLAAATRAAGRILVALFAGFHVLIVRSALRSV